MVGNTPYDHYRPDDTGFPADEGVPLDVADLEAAIGKAKDAAERGLLDLAREYLEEVQRPGDECSAAGPLPRRAQRRLCSCRGTVEAHLDPTRTINRPDGRSTRGLFFCRFVTGGARECWKLVGQRGCSRMSTCSS